MTDLEWKLAQEEKRADALAAALRESKPKGFGLRHWTAKARAENALQNHDDARLADAPSTAIGIGRGANAVGKNPVGVRGNEIVHPDEPETPQVLSQPCRYLIPEGQHGPARQGSTT